MIKVGDVVIVKDEHLPRGHWKLGVVQEVLTGRDGLTIAAVIKVAASDQRYSILRRPIQLLYPLEIHSNVSPMRDVCATPPSEDTSGPEKSDPATGSDNLDTPARPTRPRRDAARRATEMTKDWIAELERVD